MKKKHKIKECWVWNKTVEEFVKEKMKGYTLNVCAGKSPLGDVKLDLDPQDKSIIKGDFSNLPFENEKFDTVISDPCWKIGFYQRMRPFFECVRVCKVGGKIIYNAYWMPTSKATVLEEVFVRQDGDFTNSSIISVFKKLTNEFD